MQSEELVNKIMEWRQKEGLPFTDSGFPLKDEVDYYVVNPTLYSLWLDQFGCDQVI